MAAPASYWYLRAFPIKEMADVVVCIAETNSLLALTKTNNIFKDYIVYMTYDLHGQWDYISKFAE